MDDEETLASAADQGDITKERELLESGTPLTIRDIFNCTLLLRAAKHGHIEMVHLLLEHGAAVAEQDRYRQTVLY